MILVGLSGGLGNQMFQYAAGFALSQRLRTGMQIETSWYAHDFASTDSTPRRVELDDLRIDVCDYVHSPPPTGRLRTGISRLSGRRIISESNYPPERFRRIRPTRRRRGTLHLLGYWQDRSYFHEVAAAVRSQFRLRSELDATETSIRDLIRRQRSIGVHVRRGDYVHHARTSAHHGVPPVAYYEDAVRTIAAEEGVEQIFVFSDEPAWCRSSLDFGRLDVRVIDEGFSGAIEMQLLGECTHHVLSNSSFSYWGAWLGVGPAQRVIAPRGWLADGRPLANPPSHWQFR